MLRNFFGFSLLSFSCSRFLFSLSCSTFCSSGVAKVTSFRTICFQLLIQACAALGFFFKGYHFSVILLEQVSLWRYLRQNLKDVAGCGMSLSKLFFFGCCQLLLFYLLLSFSVSCKYHLSLCLRALRSLSAFSNLSSNLRNGFCDFIFLNLNSYTVHSELSSSSVAIGYSIQSSTSTLSVFDKGCWIHQLDQLAPSLSHQSGSLP